MKKIAILLFSLLLLSCSSSDNDDDNPPAPKTVNFTYSVEGLISFPKGDTEYKTPLFTSVTYKDATGTMITEAITNAKWEKTISLKTNQLFSSKIVLKYTRVENPNDERISITRKNVITYLLDGKLLRFSDTSSTTSISTNQLNTSLESRGDYELIYDVPFE